LCARQSGSVAANDRNTLINTAAKIGDLELLRNFVAAGFDLNAEAPQSFANETFKGVVTKRILYRIPASRTLFNESIGSDAAPVASCPLKLAAGSGKLDVAQYLLTGGVDIDRPCNDPGRMTPLYAAILANQPLMVEYLLQQGAKLESRFSAPPTHFALKAPVDGGEGPSQDVLQALMRHGADINGVDANGIPALFFATRTIYYRSGGTGDALEMLLALGGDPNVQSQEPDRVTTTTNHENGVLGLPGSFGRTALMHAIASSRLETKDWAMHPLPGFPFPSRLDPKVPAGAKLSCLSQLQTLLAHGANVSLADSEGFTALHYAARTDYAVEVAELLLRHGANVNARDNTGRTPLDHAVELGLKHMPGLLEKLGGRRGSELR
jgi:ankyrin repeat protein